jgi:hypothetical protein
VKLSPCPLPYGGEGDVINPHVTMSRVRSSLARALADVTRPPRAGGGGSRLRGNDRSFAAVQRSCQGRR